MTLDELFFFTKDDLSSKKKRWEVICDLLIDLKILDKRIDISITSKFKKSEEESIKRDTKAYAVNMIDILLTPLSSWTNNNQNIIWFDFNEMDKLEDWVSETLKKPFKLHSVNSSKHMECKIILNDEFKEKYDNIYDYYDFPKLKKSLI
jgi:DNA gyrase/topoisomerase IV subunit A